MSSAPKASASRFGTLAPYRSGPVVSPESSVLPTVPDTTGRSRAPNTAPAVSAAVRLPARIPAAGYSARSETMGSTDEARRAGT